jgi:hypothetical protein
MTRETEHIPGDAELKMEAAGVLLLRPEKVKTVTV